MILFVRGYMLFASVGCVVLGIGMLTYSVLHVWGGEAWPAGKAFILFLMWLFFARLILNAIPEKVSGR